MQRHRLVIHVDCPACGAAAETGEAGFWPETGEMHCRRCLFTLLAPGVVGHRGTDVPPLELGRDAGRPEASAAPIVRYRPWNARRWVLRLVPADDRAETVPGEPQRSIDASPRRDVTRTTGPRGGAR
jgi:hypothetical protein